jgi:hypothetical protein
VHHAGFGGKGGKGVADNRQLDLPSRALGQKHIQGPPHAEHSWYLRNKTLGGPVEDVALVEGVGENPVYYSRLHLWGENKAQSEMLT